MVSGLVDIRIWYPYLTVAIITFSYVCVLLQDLSLCGIVPLADHTAGYRKDMDYKRASEGDWRNCATAGAEADLSQSYR